MLNATPPAFHLLIVGDEVLSGLRQDGHFAHVRELLHSKGLRLASSMIVGDDGADITAALRYRMAQGGVVFSTGGIGSTPDDHTRAAAAKALQRPLTRHPAALALIQERICAMAAAKGQSVDLTAPLMEGRYAMADFPSGITLIPNPYNTIAGFSVLPDRLDAQSAFCHLHFFPGFPVMAWPMMEWVLSQYYAEYFGRQQEHRRACRVHGTAEGDLIPLMRALEQRYSGVHIYSLPSVDHPEYGPHIELGVKGHDAAQVEQAYAWLLQSLAHADEHKQVTPAH